MTAVAQPQHDSRRTSRQDRTARTRELFLAPTSTDSGGSDTNSSTTVIVLHLDLAHAEAERYSSRGIPLDDLRQVAALALTKADPRIRRDHGA